MNSARRFRIWISTILTAGIIFPAVSWASDAASILAKLPPKGEGNYYFVSTNDSAASDQNEGSVDKPFKTVQHGVDALKPGDTLWIRGGEYREFVKVAKSGESFEKMINVRGYPGEKAVIKGSELLAGWTRTPSEPKRAIWETEWPYRRKDKDGKWLHPSDKSAPYEKLCDSPMGKYPSMIACDDDPLLPKSITPIIEELKPPKEYCQYFIGFGRGQQAMEPGSFYYDEARNKLLVWLKGDADPNQHRMEAAVRGAWLSMGKYIRVEDLFFQYAELERPVMGGEVFVMTGPTPEKGGPDGDGNIARNLDISLGAFQGAVFRGGQRVTTLVENCRIHHNGNGMGNFHGCGLPETDSWLHVRNCEFTDNNLFNWSSRWDAGCKHLGTRVLIENCTIARHHWSPSVWFDIHQQDCIVNRCYLTETDGYGLYYEIGETGAFINNVVEGSPQHGGILTNGSSRTLVAHNLVIAPWDGIIVGAMCNVEGQGGRMNCYNSVYNNIVISRGDRAALTIIPNGPCALGNLSDNNIFWQELPAGQPEAKTPWLPMQNGDNGRRMTLEEWQKTRKLDLASRITDPLVRWRGWNVARLPNSPALSGGKRLTPDVLKALFALRPMPMLPPDSPAASIRDPQPPSRAFLEKLAELLAVPEGQNVPIGPLPEKQ